MQAATAGDSSGANRKSTPDQPNWLIRVVSGLLAPLGIGWAKQVQEEIARAKREAAERLADEAREQGRQAAEGAAPDSSP